MGWGTTFTTDIFLSRMSFDSKSEVEDKITEINNYVDICKTNIKLYASSTPRDIIPEDWKDEPIQWINNKLDEEFNSLSEYENELRLLNQYLNYLEENDINIIKKNAQK